MAKTPTPKTTTTSQAAGASATAPVAPATTESSTVPSAPPEGDSTTNSTGTADQPSEAQPQQPQGESGAEGVGSSITAPVAPATTESSTVPDAQPASFDLWVKNLGAFSKTEPRSKVLLGAGQVTQIKIASAVMRQTIERNIEQMNHLAGGRLLVLVDQPVVSEPQEGS